MTQPLPTPENEPESQSESSPPPAPAPRRRRRWWLRGLVAGLTLGGAGFAIAWFALLNYLSPILTDLLTKELDRPVKLGPTSGLSLRGVRFGRSEIPPTAKDTDRAVVEAVDVTFNLWRVLTDKTLELNLTLVQPTAYIEQDLDGQWIATRLREQEGESEWEIDVKTIRAENANVIVVARDKKRALRQPVELNVDRATVRAYQNYQLLEGDAKGKFIDGGRFNVATTIRPQTLQGKVYLAAQQLDLLYLNRLLEVPVILRSGKISTNLEVQLNGNPLKILPNATGILALQNVSAKLDEQALGIQSPQVRAQKQRQQQPTAIEERPPLYFLNNLPIAIPDIKQANGRIAFQGQSARFESFSARVGQINAQLGGSVDAKTGFNLNATTQPLTIANLLKTFGLKQPPIPVAGEFEVALQAKGPFDKPIVTSRILSTKTIQFDRATFKDVRAQLAFVTAKNTLFLQSLDAIPTQGGRVRGGGQVRFNKDKDPGQIALNFQTQNLPADAIASLYVPNLPVTIGPVSANAQLLGPFTKIEDLQAQIAARLYDGGILTVQNARIKDGRFFGRVAAAGVQLNRFLPATSPLRPIAGTGEALFDLSGPLQRLTVERLTVAGVGRAAIAGGTVTASNIQLQNGRFYAQINAANVQAGQVAPKILPSQVSLPSLGTLNGAFQVAGQLRTQANGKPTVGGLTGAGALGVAVAGGFVEARRIGVSGDRWRADVAVNNIDANRIATLSNLPPAARSLQQLLGKFSGNFQLAGNVGRFDLNTLAVNGTGQTRIAGGTANLAATVNRGNWFARINTNGVQLPPLTAGLNLPPVVARTQRELGAFTGTVLATGNLNSFNPNTLVANATGRLAAAGGAADVNLKLNRGNWFADVAANSVQLTRLTAGLNLPLPIARAQQSLGAFTGNLRASGNLNSFNLNSLIANATGRLDAAGGTANVNLKANRGNWFADIAANGVQLPRLTAGLNLPAPVARAQQSLGAFTGNLRASGSLSSFSPNTVVANASGRLDAAGGTANVNLKANRGSWIADVVANNVQLNRLTAGLDLPPALARPQQALGAFTGTLRAAGNLNSFDAKTLTASSQGQLNLAGGRANLDLNLTGGRWLATVKASDIQPQQLLANIPPQFQTPISGDLDLRGTLSDLRLNAVTATGSGRLNLAGGQLLANNLRLAKGSLQTTLVPNNIELAGLVNGLRGKVSGNLDVTANLANLSPEGIRARGNVNLSEEVLPLQGPVAATFDWNGGRLSIARATGTGLDASGYVDVNTAALRRGKLGLDAISRFDLDVSLQGLKLDQLSEQAKKFIAFPPNLAPAVQQTRLAGLADFSGNLRGTPAAPQINGNLALRDAKFNEFVLEPLVSGPIAFAPGQGGTVRLAGTRDRIEVALAADYKPNSFLIKVDELYAEGTRQGDILTATTRNIPIAYARSLAPPQLIPSAIAGQPLSGRLSGDFQVNLATLAASGRIDVKNPIFSRISGDRLTASFEYANGSGVIRDAVFQQGETQYAIDGRIVQTARGPQFNAEVGIKAGRIQDILATAQIFKISDLTTLLQLPVYGKANTIAAVPIDIRNQPLIQQLRRLSEIQALLEEQRKQRLAASPFPPLSEATGGVEGKISVAGSLAEGLDINFDLNGADWKWGPFVANTTVAQGSYQKGVLTIRPFQMQLADGGSISFAGAVGGETQSGQLQVEKLPVALIQEFVALPPDIGLTGFVNASAVLSGTQQNPQARGQLTVVDAELNQEKVESAQGNFSYNQGILNFAVDSIIAAGTEPLTIAGKFPYRFPLPNAVKASSDVFELTLNLKNNGLSVLNALTRQQLIWKNGEGSVDLAIAGRYEQEKNRLLDLKANGTANLKNAEVASLLLADSLKNLNGQILFDFDKITVQSLTSQFGGGEVTAAGSLALTQPVAQENPLAINLKKLAVNLKGLYNGDASGNIRVAGALLQPVLGGNLELTDGRVLLAGLATFGSAGRGGFVNNSGGAPTPGGLSQIVAATQFDNLALTLGNGLRLEQPLLVNFSTDGTILLNGRTDDIAPQGVVRLTRGQINLFATQLRLQNGYNNVAIFRPEYGLNPRLDLRLVGSAIESNRTQIATEAFSSEIRESLVNFGSVETVRIEAIVDGFALALLESLQVEPGVASAQKVRSVLKLTSSPPRSETQIIALLGGSFINAFSQDDAGLGLANLASNALLGSIQNALADSLGLSEFRIYPSVVPNTDDRTSAFGIAAELGFNVTDSLGVSVTQFLTPQVPTELNLRYRLNDYVVVRGSSNFGSDYRLQVEYRQRF